jgi:nitroreductase
MEFRDLIEQRYSVRTYRPDPVPEDTLNTVLEAARLAPSADSHQPYRLIVMRTAGREDELRRIYHRDWFVQAPLVIAAVALPGEAWERSDGTNYAWVDTAIMFIHLMLAAADLGLGTCWVANFDPDEARAVLGLPDGAEVVGFTPLGYPADEPGFKRRKALDEIVRYERW